MSIFVALSDVSDGNMWIPSDPTDKDVIENRSAFLKKQDIAMDQTTRLNVTYNGKDYLRYFEIDKDQKSKGMYGPNSMEADALITRDKNHALFLPLADCVGTVIYDPVHEILMLSHLGRHSIEQNGGFESVAFLEKQYDSNPSDLLVWLTSSPGIEVYPLYAFNNRQIKDVVFEQLHQAGILKDNITDNPAETDKDSRYYSYSEFLHGRRDIDGRHSIVAMMR